MKIVICSPGLNYQADAPYSTRVRANAMASQGLTVTVVGFPSVYPPQVGKCLFKYFSVLESQSARTKARWLKWKEKLGPYWSFAIEPFLVKWAAYMYARKSGADAVYVANVEPWLLLPILWLNWFLGLRIPTATMIPYIFKATAGRTLSSQLRARLNHRAARWLTRLCDIVCDNIHVARMFKIDQHAAVHLIPEGHVELTGVPSQAEARHALGIPTGERVLLLFGAAGRSKGADILFSALQHLEPKFMLYVVGQTGGVYEASWGQIDQLHASGWKKNLQVVPRFVSETEMAQFFSACDAVILPYRHGYATTSGNLTMAVDNGKAIIASDQYYIGDMVKTNQLGLVFPPEDIPALRRCLQEFSEKPEAWFETIRQNSRQVVQRLSWNNIGAKYRLLFEQLVASETMKGSSKDSGS